MKNVLANDALDLAIRALERSKDPNPATARDELDTAIRELAVVVRLEKIKPDDKGISPEVIPSIIQLMLLEVILRD